MRLSSLHSLAAALPLSACVSNSTRPEGLAKNTAEVSAEGFRPLTMPELQAIAYDGTKKIARSRSTFDFSVQPRTVLQPVVGISGNGQHMQFKVVADPQPMILFDNQQDQSCGMKMLMFINDRGEYR
jgi:hypothetical protein